jgi:hypothetical protein
MFLDQVGGEAVMAGGHRRVGGEGGLAGYPLQRLLKAHTLRGHALLDEFQPGEGAVAFVQV